MTYTLGGIDAASFGIEAAAGQLLTKAPLDFETKHTYAVSVSVSDGKGGTDTISVTIYVTDLFENNPPVFTEGENTSRSIAENTSAGENIGEPVIATDLDLWYRCGSFGIEAAAGVVDKGLTRWLFLRWKRWVVTIYVDAMLFLQKAKTHPSRLLVKILSRYRP